MTARYRPPVLLDRSHLTDEFVCRSTEQTAWLQRHAVQSIAADSTRVFVVTEPADSRVVAYYAWRMAHLDVEAAPARLRKGAGRFPQPVALLARLGVHLEHEGRGLGTALLADVVTRLLTMTEEIGCRALLIHAEGDDARRFYLHLIPELMASPTDDLHLVLTTKDARRTLM